MYSYDRTASTKIKDRIETVVTFLRMKHLKTREDDFSKVEVFEISVSLELKVPVVMPAMIFEAIVEASATGGLLSVAVQDKRTKPLGAYVERLLLDEWHDWVHRLLAPR